MLKVWEIHKDLSLSLGDGVMASSTVIPDGVRYTKQLRDSYLYRAMLELYRNILQPFVTYNRKAYTYYIVQQFQRSILTESIVYNDTEEVWNNMNKYNITLTRELYYLISISILSEDKSYPIPIKSPFEFNRLINSRVIQRPDAFAVIDNQTVPQEFCNISLYCDLPINKIEVRYLPIPKNPSLQGNDEFIEIEDKYIQYVISLATLYGKIDSQEIESIERFMPTILNVPVTTPQTRSIYASITD